MAGEHENIISLGSINTDNRQGLTPLIFKLKHSGIIFRLPFTMDFTGIGKMKNYYKKEAEIPLLQPTSAYLSGLYTLNPYALEYIKFTDPYIKYIRNE